MRKILEVRPPAGYAPEVAGWLWAMEAARERTKRHMSGLGQDVVDWAGPDGTENSIGTLLYHVAIVEMGWLHNEILDQWELFPADDFPFEPFTEHQMTPVVGVSALDHVARLDRSRAIFLERMKPMTVRDWSRVREPVGEDYTVSPSWAVFHLVEHEAGHAAQIAVMKKRAQAALRRIGGS